MKKIFLSFLLAGMLCSVQAQIAPSASPMARTFQIVGLTEVEVEYSRPGVKDRDIFTEIIPFGELWRTGANAASKISFSTTVYFGGIEVPAGTYALFTIPNKGAFTIILNSNANQGGTGSYNQELDVARVEAALETSPTTVERMRFSIEDMTDASGKLVWAWGNYTFNVPIKVDSGMMAEQKIADKLKEIEGLFSFYNEAARYYLDNGKDPKQALAWAQKSVELRETFWNTHTLARAAHAAGDKAAAKKHANKSLELSKTAGNNAYAEMNQKLLAQIK